MLMILMAGEKEITNSRKEEWQLNFDFEQVFQLQLGIHGPIDERVEDLFLTVRQHLILRHQYD